MSHISFINSDSDWRLAWTIRTNRLVRVFFRGWLTSVAISILKQKSFGSRMAAVLLGKAAVSRAVPALIDAMTSGRARLAKSCARQLNMWAIWEGTAIWPAFPQLSERSVAQLIRSVAHSDPTVRAVAARLLGKTKNARVAPVLGNIIRAESEPQSVRSVAINSLANLPREFSLPELNASTGINDLGLLSEIAVIIGDDMTESAKSQLVDSLDQSQLAGS